MTRTRGRNRRRTPQAGRSKLTTSAPVAMIGPAKPPAEFHYSIGQWVAVVSARQAWPPAANLERMRVELERAGQAYRSDRAQLRRRRRQLIEAVLWAWTSASTQNALEFSRTDGRAGGPLIRFLTAALSPIFERRPPGTEGLAKAITRERLRRRR